jgi:hypothetical protein
VKEKGDFNMGHIAEKIVSGLICEKDLTKIREAVCIQTEKIYDSCREKDCIENSRVRFDDLCEKDREIINNAFNVKAKKAEVMDVITDVEPVPFKRGFFTVDVKFIIKVTLDFFTENNNDRVRVTPIEGFISFDKKVILFGSEGNVKIFKTLMSEHYCGGHEKSKMEQSNLPIAKVEVADPIPLSAKIRGILDKLFDERSENEVELAEDARCHLTKRVFVTVGLFSIIKLERLVQLLIPAFDFCFPIKECIASTEQNPCELFETIEFPFEEFFPPQKHDFPGAMEQENAMFEEMDEHTHHHHKGENA